MKYADLHIHTTASDGILEPKEVVVWAKRKNLTTIAITDHDTTEGLDSALAMGAQMGIEVIPGIELGTYLDGYEVHILGYYIDYTQVALQEQLEALKSWRDLRAYKMIDKLNDLYDIGINVKDVKRNAGDAALARPHIGRTLVEMGLVKNIKEAFDVYIGNRCPAYTKRRTLSPIRGIELIKVSGGIPVLAHPGLVGKARIVDEVIDLGIEGLEVYHPSHSPSEERRFFRLCNKHELHITGGSDFHDDFSGNSPNLGQRRLHYNYVDRLRSQMHN